MCHGVLRRPRQGWGALLGLTGGTASCPAGAPQVEDALLDAYDALYEQAVRSGPGVGPQELVAIQEVVSDAWGPSSPLLVLTDMALRSPGGCQGLGPTLLSLSSSSAAGRPRPWVTWGEPRSTCAGMRQGSR